jgi:hypothetical protein
MTTDERLDRLTERTDALTQSVELLASLHRDYEARAEERAVKMDRNMERIIGLIEKIGNMVGNHEDRLRKLEGE